MRYIKQPDKFSCGPTAILNAMKWAGIDANGRDHIPYLQFACRTYDLEDMEGQGTFNHDFDRVLRYVGKGSFAVKRKKNPTLSEMRRHLKAGHAIALAYHWEDGGQSGEHFCFIAGLWNGLFICINDHTELSGPTIRLRRPETVRKWLKKYEDCPTAWFLMIEN
jgi:hypothetical protein